MEVTGLKYLPLEEIVPGTLQVISGVWTERAALRELQPPQQGYYVFLSYDGACRGVQQSKLVLIKKIAA
jgi:hypothetical protein